MKVSKAYFERFKKEFLYWQKELGLTQYNVSFFQERLDKEYAKITINEMAKTVDVYLGTELKGRSLKSYEGPESNAKHEAIHMLLHRLIFLGERRYIGSIDLDEEWESVVVRLEKVLNRKGE